MTEKDFNTNMFLLGFDINNRPFINLKTKYSLFHKEKQLEVFIYLTGKNRTKTFVFTNRTENKKLYSYIKTIETIQDYLSTH